MSLIVLKWSKKTLPVKGEDYATHKKYLHAKKYFLEIMKYVASKQHFSKSFIQLKVKSGEILLKVEKH